MLALNDSAVPAFPEEPMQHTLHDHIILLEQRIQILKDQLTRVDRSSMEISRISSEIQTAELALLYYRKAFELENRGSQIQRDPQMEAQAEECSGSEDLPCENRDSLLIEKLYSVLVETERILRNTCLSPFHGSRTCPI
jgi:hypothetical protein